MTQKTRRLDQVLDPDFAADLESMDLDQVRTRRDLAEEVENELSYYRRLLHGRMDLLDFETRRRSGAETRTLIEALPEILTGRDRSGDARGRHLSTSLPELPVAGGRRHLDRVLGADVLVGLSEFDDSELAAVQEELAEVEAEISTLRRQVQGVLDRVQAEIIARYKSGITGPALRR